MRRRRQHAASDAAAGDGAGAHQAWEPFGEWQQLSTGQVSADGQTISTTPGQGLPVLDNFGVALAQ